MRVSTAAAAAAAVLAVGSHLVGAHLEFGAYKMQQLALEVVSLVVVGEWGGQSAAPYTTPGQLSAAEAMATVADLTAATFVLSPGGNFLADGIQGASQRNWQGGPTPQPLLRWAF